MTNRLAYGLATFSWGGSDYNNLPQWSLAASDFVTCDARDFDKFVPPADTKLEARTRPPATSALWREQVINGISVFESIYGLEHGSETRAALEAFVQAHKTDKDCWVIIGDDVFDVTNFLADHPGVRSAAQRRQEGTYLCI